jgi:hypothetical protein
MAQLSVLTQYIEFCASPLRDAASIEAEYAELKKNPFIKMVAFHKPHILMLGTAPLIIPWDGVEYEIGEFIIFLIRKREGRVWETGFRFANISHPVEFYDLEGVNRGFCMHPHIISFNYDDIECTTGELCISSGQQVIYQSLRKGLVNKAFVHLWLALKMYGTGSSFCTINFWPQFLEEKSHD